MDKFPIFDIGNDDILLEKERTFAFNDLTDELLLENIYEQINTGIDKTNYIEAFEVRYRFLNHKYSGDSDITNELRDIRDQFFYNIQSAIFEKFGIEGIETDEASRQLLIRTLYQFLVINLEGNTKRFLINFILTNNFDSAINNKTNIHLSTLKKRMVELKHAKIIAFIDDIFESIVASNVSPYTILELMTVDEPSELNNFIMKSYFIDRPENIGIDDDKFRKVIFSALKPGVAGYYTYITEITKELVNIFPKKEVK